MQYRRSQNEIISYLIVLHSVGDLVSLMFTHQMLNFKSKWQTIIHFTLLYTIQYSTFFTVIYMKSKVVTKFRRQVAVAQSV
jgi:hypothetical protein